MKKLLVLTATAALALSACAPTQEEPAQETKAAAATTSTSTAATTVTSPPSTPGPDDTSRADAADSGAGAAGSGAGAAGSGAGAAGSGASAGSAGSGATGADLSVKSADPTPADAALQPVSMRIGSHENYDRVVLEFSGDAKPGYRAKYVDKPVQQASGNPVQHRGNAALNIDVTGTTMPEDFGASLGGPQEGTGVVQEVVPLGTFEDRSQYVIGLDEERPYTVTTLENPTRVVVDIQK